MALGYGKRRNLLDRIFNPSFNPDMPYGRCEAGWNVAGPIPRVTCGRKTNLQTLGYWHCDKHFPPVGTKQKPERIK